MCNTQTSIPSSLNSEAAKNNSFQAYAENCQKAVEAAKAAEAEANTSAAPKTPFFVVSEGTANLLQAYAENCQKVAQTTAFVAAFWGTNEAEADTSGTMAKAAQKVRDTGEAYLQSLKDAVFENIDFELMAKNYSLSTEQANTI